MKRFLINEIERRRILGLYGIITEDIDPNSGGSVTINNVYKAGWYTTAAIDQLTNKTIKKQLDDELVKVTEFVRKYPNSIVSVKFTSQESAIPNTDNEKAGFFKSKVDSRLEVGELSGARKAYIDQYIQSYFKNLKDTGVIKSEVQIPPVEYTFKPPVKKFMDTKSTTPWCIKGDPQIPKTDTQGYACTGMGYKVDGATTNNWYNQKKGIYKSHYDEFVKEQNSSIEITVKLVQEVSTTTTTGPVTTTTTVKTLEACAAELKIRIHVPVHKCQNAEFFIFANKTFLYNSVGGLTANLNNNDQGRGVPKGNSEPMFYPECLNPGYGYLKNGDGTYGGYAYGTINESGDLGKGRSDTFTITKEMSTQILKDGNGFISIWMVGTTTGMHIDIPQVEISKADGTLIFKDAPKIQEGVILTIDGCNLSPGNVKKGEKEEKPDVTGYINLLRQEKIRIMGQIDVAAQKTGGTKKAQKERQTNLDTKTMVIERAEGLVTSMTEFLQTLYTELMKTQPVTTKDGKLGYNKITKEVGPDGKEIEKTQFVADPNYKNNGSPQAQSLIDSKYKEFEKALSYSGTSEKPEPQLGKDGPDGEYINKTIRSNELFGDIRMYMDQFYEGFNAVYKSTDTEDNQIYSPNGIRRTTKDKPLNGGKILSNIKNLKQYNVVG